MKLKIAVVQPETLTGGESPRNVERAVAYIREAAREGARLIALPETYPGPYTVPLAYSSEEALSAVARDEKVYVVGGALEYVNANEGGRGAYNNCQIGRAHV